MRVYVASSWRNEYQPDVVHGLREIGHEVYDFRNPYSGVKGFHWSEIDSAWKGWSPGEYRDALEHPLAEAGFNADMEALRLCDALVAVQPFGRSASLELGWACGAGRFTALLLSDGEPELMVKMVDCIAVGLGEILLALQHYEDSALGLPRPQPLGLETPLPNRPRPRYN
jgi:hypothetical protein